MNSRVLVAQLGARMHYAVPRLLHEAGMLKRFYTDSYIGNKPWLEAALRTMPKALQSPGLQRWLGRKDSGLPPGKVVSFEVFGWWYAWRQSRARGYAQRDHVYARAAQLFNQRIISAGLEEPDVVWGFNGAALELFHAGKAKGARCILEQTMLPRRQETSLLREECERWPGWEPGLESPGAVSLLAAREEREWQLADCIVAGSEFVRDGLLVAGVPAHKIRVVPYGVDTARFTGSAIGPRTPSEGSLKVLFAGQVGLRKGVPDLLQALQRFKPGQVEARIAGGVVLDEQRLAQFRGGAQFLGHVPRSEMRRLFQWADVFVLPSIVEGSATVTYEALMSGVPVVTTPNAGSIVRDGVDGFVVPIRNPSALADAIARYQQDRALLARHRSTATESRQRAGLDRYRADLERVVRDVVQARKAVAPTESAMAP